MLAIDGTTSRSSPMRLGMTSELSELTPVALPPGRLRLADLENDRDRAGRDFGRERGLGRGKRHDHRHRPADELGGKLRQPVASPFGPAVVDRDVLAFDEAQIAQALAKARQPFCVRCRRAQMQKADHRHCGLGTRGEGYRQHAADPVTKLRRFICAS
jgi:hypothetical protein